MLIVSERHDDGLLLRHRWCPVQGGQADGASGSSRLGNSGEIGTPDASVDPSRACHASGTDASSLHATRDTKSHAVNALFLRELPQRERSVAESYRAQCLAEMLRCIHEARTAIPSFRVFWRTCARYEIRQFRRLFLIPERAAFEAAVAQQSRRAA